MVSNTLDNTYCTILSNFFSGCVILEECGSTGGSDVEGLEESRADEVRGAFYLG